MEEIDLIELRDVDGNKLEPLRTGKDKIEVKDGRWYRVRPKEISDMIFYGDTICIPSDPDKEVSPENPQTFLSQIKIGRKE